MPTALPAGLDINREHPLEALRPAHRPLPIDGRWLIGLHGLAGSSRARFRHGPRPVAARRREQTVVTDQVGARLGHQRSETRNKVLGVYANAARGFKPGGFNTNEVIELEGQTSSAQTRAEAGNICADFSVNAVAKNPEHAFNNATNDDTIRMAQRNVDPGNPEGFAPGRSVIAYLPEPRVAGLRVVVNFGL